MTDKNTELRNQLLKLEQMSPTVRQAYQQEIDAILHPPLTTRRKLPGIGLLVILLVCIAGLVRNLIFHRAEGLTLIGWIVLTIAFTTTAFVIMRSMWRGKFEWKPYFSIAHMLTFAAGTLTVVALVKGLSAPSNPASTFNAFYVFVFYFACVAWALENRIAAAELASREQMLRVECRLADIAERMGK